MLQPNSARLAGHLDEGRFAGAIDSNIKVELTLGSLHFGDVDMEMANGVGFEFSPDRLVTLYFRQS